MTNLPHRESARSPADSPKGRERYEDYPSSLPFSLPMTAKTNSPTLAGTSGNHFRLPLLQPRELGRRQARQEAGSG